MSVRRWKVNSDDGRSGEVESTRVRGVKREGKLQK